MVTDISQLDAEATRTFPRYRTSLPVNVKGLSLHTNNVSLSGLQLSCPHMMLEMMGADIEGSLIQLILTIPGQSEVSVECRVVYVSDHGDEYLIGLEFHEFGSAGKTVFEDYIDDLSQRLPSSG